MTSECRHCAGPCDPLLHDAVLRARGYLRERIALVLGEVVDTEPHPSKPHRQPPAIRVERPAVEVREHKYSVESAERRRAIIDMHVRCATDPEIAAALKLSTQCVRAHLKGRRIISRKGNNGKGKAA